MELSPQAGRKPWSTDLGSFPCEVVLGLGSRSARCQLMQSVLSLWCSVPRRCLHAKTQHRGEGLQAGTCRGLRFSRADPSPSSLLPWCPWARSQARLSPAHFAQSGSRWLQAAPASFRSPWQGSPWAHRCLFPDSSSRFGRPKPWHGFFQERA